MYVCLLSKVCGVALYGSFSDSACMCVCMCVFKAIVLLLLSAEAN